MQLRLLYRTTVVAGTRALNTVSMCEDPVHWCCTWCGLQSASLPGTSQSCTEMDNMTCLRLHVTCLFACFLLSIVHTQLLNRELNILHQHDNTNWQEWLCRRTAHLMKDKWCPFPIQGVQWNATTDRHFFSSFKFVSFSFFCRGTKYSPEQLDNKVCVESDGDYACNWWC